MIVFQGFNFSCEKCKVGHRTSLCAHLDQNLVEVLSKGRPSTQCTFCKSQRSGKIKGAKTAGAKSNHHKCPCGDGSFYDAEIDVVLLVQQPGGQDGTVKLTLQRGYPKKSNEFLSALSQSGQTRLLVKGKKCGELDLSAEVVSSSVVAVKQSQLGQQQARNPCRCYETGHCICSQISTSSINRRRNLSLTKLAQPPVTQALPTVQGSCGCCATLPSLSTLLSSNTSLDHCPCTNAIHSSCSCLCCI